MTIRNLLQAVQRDRARMQKKTIFKTCYATDRNVNLMKTLPARRLFPNIRTRGILREDAAKLPRPAISLNFSKPESAGVQLQLNISEPSKGATYFLVTDSHLKMSDIILLLPTTIIFQ
ncbi:hypothetical protein ACTXT7_004059 [Hymenolepis weldensis]